MTGAAGKTGRAIIQALLAKEQTVRALVRRPEQVTLLKQLGVQEIVVGDMRAQATLRQATSDVRAVYHIGPNMHPNEGTMGQAAIAAARASGVEHFVYHSVLHPQIEAMPHHWHKLRVEEKLFSSGLSFTILQPTAYMQNVLAQWSHIIDRGLYPVPYAADTRLSMVDLDDVAEVAAAVLTQPGHMAATYELCGSENLSQSELVAILEQQLGHALRVEHVPIETWKERARESGLGDTAIETLVKMFQYYQHSDFTGNSRVLGWLLGRVPTTFAEFIERVGREKKDA